jgi:UDP-N-acetyl-D-glucosamine 4,6-dehydratase
MEKMIVLLVPLKVVFFYIYKIYFVTWRFFGLIEYKKLIEAHTIVYTVFSLILFVFYDFFTPFPRSVIFIDFFLSIFFIGSLRIVRRLFLERGDFDKTKKALIYGVNNKSIQIIKSALNREIEYYPMAIVSDDKKSVGTYLSNIKVYSSKDLDLLIKKNNIKSIIITQEFDRSRLDSLVKKLHSLNVKDIKRVQLFEDENRPKLQNISVEDLLARKPKDLDKKVIKEFIKNKTILITGAGGSIGSELARQCIKYDAKHLLLLDHSEYNLYKIEQELEGKNITAIMQSVVNRKLLEKTFKEYDIDIIFHAAAYKHVPLCEENVEEAILNNIVGTKNCMDLAVKYGVKKFVMISTDKAVRPTNVMGATKRVCELYGQNLKNKKTEIVSVRFGNVLGSSGSVIPKFKKQIEEGGPITVTHPEITRYFMLIPEACQLVLQAGAIGKGGELFILDMGEPVKIVDLAKKMCELSGRDDIEIVYTGLRKGEKLYEELLINEADAKTKYDSIMIAKPTSYDIEKLQKEIEELLQEEDKISILKKIVPEFKHNSI